MTFYRWAKDVSPAPAGMIPAVLLFRLCLEGEPRTRGDDPQSAVIEEVRSL